MYTKTCTIKNLKDISEKDLTSWENFLCDHAKGGSVTLFQSLEWKDVVKALIPNEHVELVTIQNQEGQMLCGGVVYTYPLGRGLYWLYIPRGPIFEENLTLHEMKECLDLFIQTLQDVHNKKCVWIRFDPRLGEEYVSVFEHHKKAHKAFHPEATLELDLTLSEDDLLAQMKQKGRYNIRLAEKKGVVIEGYHWDGKRWSAMEHEMFEKTSAPLKDPVAQYVALAKETGKRDEFSLPESKYYTHLLKTLSDSGAFLILAKHGSTYIAGGIFTVFGDTLTYYYGASSNTDRHLMAPYLLQWKAIMYGKNILKKETYDFMGMSDSDPSYKGVNAFKNKFGGKKHIFVGTYEYVSKKLVFQIILLLKKIRKLKRK